MKKIKFLHTNYKHISFDLWLTIIKSNPEFKEKRNQLFKDFFKIEKTLDEVAQKIRFYDINCNLINEKTGLNFDTFQIYYLILNSLEVSLDKFDTNKLNQFYNETEKLFFEYKPLLCFENIKEQFDFLRNNNISMNILSNTAFIKGKTLRKLMNIYDFDQYFLFQIYSDECGLSKPNYEIFNLLYLELNKLKKVDKTEILHVGDNKIADYNGAINYGFEALLIKH